MRYFRLGRVVGIDIHVNWSWLLIFGLVSWSLSLTFGQIHNEWSLNVRWGMAMLAAFLFFCSVLVHELAHLSLFQLGLRWLKRFLATGLLVLPDFQACLSNLRLKPVVIQTVPKSNV